MAAAPSTEMMMMDLTGFVLALALTFVIVPLVRKKAMAAGAFDVPDERKIHTAPIPRLGGVAMWLGFILALGLVIFISDDVSLKRPLPGIMLGGAMMFLMGLADDLKNLSPYLKLGIQFAAAITAFCLGVQVSTLDLPNSQLLVLNALSLPVTLVWIVGLSNAMNFIDGVDGLASGVTLISALTLVVIATFTGQPTEALLAAILAGCSLGFLAFNFHPAKIFMGDSGSLFCGFMLATIAVTGVLKTKVVMMLLPFCVLLLPITDITFSVFRRLAAGKNPFLPDASHIHHQFIKAGKSQVETVSYLYALCVVGGIIATQYVNYLAVYILLLLVVFGLGTALVAWVRKRYPVAAEPLPPDLS